MEVSGTDLGRIMGRRPRFQRDEPYMTDADVGRCVTCFGFGVQVGREDCALGGCVTPEVGACMEHKRGDKLSQRKLEYGAVSGGLCYFSSRYVEC
jgi:hypothetical protein